MTKFSRDKGALFEREVGNFLHEELGIRFERDLEQYRKADRGDLIPRDPAFPFLIECKRRGKGFSCETAWRQQASTAALAARKIPAVIFRYDNKPTRVSVPLRAFCEAWPMDQWAEITLPGFCFIVREIMADAAGEWGQDRINISEATA